MADAPTPPYVAGTVPAPWKAQYTLRLKVTDDDARAIQAYIEGGLQLRLHVNELSIKGNELKLELVSR